MKLAIVLPLFDREGTGWKSLESALAQTLERSRYEIVAIVGGRSEDDVRADAYAQELLARCDAVVRFGEDLDGVENRMRICRAGADAVSADILYLAEGHTVLRPDACERIARHFAAAPSSQILYAARAHHSGTKCSEVHEYLNRHNSARAPANKIFSLGGESALRRHLFLAMCKAAENAGPFAETVIQQELCTNGTPVAVLDRPLCDHFNLWTAQRTAESAMMLGRAYRERFDHPLARILGLTGRKRAIYGFAGRNWIAAPLWPLAALGGALCIRLALPLFGLRKDLCRVLFAFGVKASVLAGFCKASLARDSGAASVPLPRAPGRRG